MKHTWGSGSLTTQHSFILRRRGWSICLRSLISFGTRSFSSAERPVRHTWFQATNTPSSRSIALNTVLNEPLPTTSAHLAKRPSGLVSKAALSSLLSPCGAGGSSGEVALAEGSLGPEVVVALGPEVVLAEGPLGPEVVLAEVALGPEVVLAEGSLGPEVVLAEGSLGPEVVLAEGPLGPDVVSAPSDVDGGWERGDAPPEASMVRPDRSIPTAAGVVGEGDAKGVAFLASRHTPTSRRHPTPILKKIRIEVVNVPAQESPHWLPNGAIHPRSTAAEIDGV